MFFSSVLVVIAAWSAATSSGHAQATPLAPGGEVSAEPVAAPPAVAQAHLLPSAAFAPETSAWRQLQVLQQREAELWHSYDSQSFAGPGVAIGLGFVAASILLPIGGILMADANAQYCSGSSSSFGESSYSCEDRDKRQFRVGSSLLTFGLASLAGAVWGIVRVRQLRKARSRSDRELRSIAESRTVLENILGARYAQ